MAGRAGDDGLPLGLGLLRESWQRVILAENRDDRLARSIGGREGRGNLRDFVFDRKTGRLQFRFQQGRAADFFIANFSELPHLAGHVAEVLRATIHLAEHVIPITAAIVGGLGRCKERDKTKRKGAKQFHEATLAQAD